MEEIKYKTPKELEQLSSTEISQYISDFESRQKKIIEYYGKIEREKLELQRQTIEIRLKQKELEITLSKGDTLKSECKIAISQATKMFWSIKNEGR